MCDEGPPLHGLSTLAESHYPKDSPVHMSFHSDFQKIMTWPSLVLRLLRLEILVLSVTQKYLPALNSQPNASDHPELLNAVVLY